MKNTVTLKLIVNLEMSDELLKKLETEDELYRYVIRNAFRNNSRTVDVVEILEVEQKPLY